MCMQRSLPSNEKILQVVGIVLTLWGFLFYFPQFLSFDC